MRTTNTIWPALTLAGSVLGLALAAMPATAATPPELSISVPSYGSVTVDSTGAESYTGSCNASTCGGAIVIGDGTNGLQSGQISWNGTVQNFSASIIGTSAHVATLPQLDLDISGITTTGAANVTVSWMDVGFTMGGTPATMNVIGAGAGTNAFTSYVDNTNAPFGQGTTVNTLPGPGTATGPGPTSAAFSMTDVAVLGVPAGLGSSLPPASFDFLFNDAPTPLALDCSALTAGTVGSPYSASLIASGGIAPYTFSITGGSLSPLTLNMTSGLISGTPTVSGTLSFTAQVVDSSGNPVTNTASSSCTISDTPPGILLTKSASPASVAVTPGQPFPLVTFTYIVTNNSGTTLTNVVVTDDNGTPGDKSDDYIVGTIASLAPGASQTFTWTTYPPLSTVILDSSLGTIPGGSLTIQNENLPSGCIPNKTCWLKVVLDQALTLNDNSYGSNATSGWASKGHKFNDLIGSDQAWFAFYDAKGNLVLETDEDYISQAGAPSASCPNQGPSGVFNSSYPSGYGTLGWCGGDGKFISGTSSYVIAHDSTLTDNLNQSSAFYGYTTNSPASSDPNFSKWNLVDGYTVVIDPAAFGSNGFGWVTIPLIHNSPSMNSTDQISPVPASSTSTNTATLTADGGISATATATVTITSSYTAASPSGGGGSAPPPGGRTTSSVTVTFPGGPAANGVVGTSYSQTIHATGGTGPYTFVVTAGTLPAGLTLNSSTGVISGVPTTMTGGPAASITIQATDSKTNQGSATGNINITAPPPIKVTFPGGPAANGILGTPYSASFTATGGAGAYTFSITNGALPAGLSLNASTGAITGTPTHAVSGPAAQLTVKVTDAYGDSGTATGAINVNPPAPLHVTFPGGPAANGTVGTPYSASITATGGLGAYTFSITAGALPVGLTLNSSTGAITGTPTVAVGGPAAQLTVGVTDAYGDSASATGAINIAAAAPAPPKP